MLPLLIVSFLAFQDAPRLKVELPNRAIAFVERFDKAKLCAVHLVASSRGVEESKATHGWRHLLEHLMVKGRRGTLDKDLESQGLFLRAQTYRDYMVVSIEGPNNRIDRALDAIAEVLQPVQTTQDAINQEVKLIGSELAISPDTSKLSAAAWLNVYGEAGLDPQGSPETMLNATPAAIADLQKRNCAPRNVVLAVCGDFDIDRIATKAKKIVGSLSELPSVPVAERKAGKPGRVDAEGAFGELRAAPVKGCLDRSTAAAIAAGFAVSSMNRDVAMTYTFTNRNGLVSVCQTANNSGMGLSIDKLEESERSALFAIGRQYAMAWIGSMLADASSHTRLRAILIATGSVAMPEEMLDNLAKMTMADFTEAIGKLTAENCTIATGASR